MIQYEKLGNCRLQSVQTIASFLYHFFYIPYLKFKKEVLSLPAKVSNKIKDDGKQKARLCLGITALRFLLYSI
ncbi:hypothetical protein V7T12_05925 [Segatella copri]|uniref:hypothetical protein n=1 Tax=Segatella copri TaxID=165179 RepID=UPI002FF20E12